MFRMNLFVIIAMLAFVSGCVTTPVVNYSGENQQLKTQVNSLETQLNQLKQENFQLRQQLQQQAAVKKEVRMPNASEIQAALKKAGFYKGPVDGQIGTQTKESIKKFQEANKINPDGVVGSKTWQLLLRYLEK
ncbi:MAG: peptidoglycan-binding protein [Candidatus Omnitrophica bacterium]|nr:peptidoglycan-binding protein [Candidatus Omnitrophota bacterium]